MSYDAEQKAEALMYALRETAEEREAISAALREAHAAGERAGAERMRQRITLHIRRWGTVESKYELVREIEAFPLDGEEGE